MSEKTFRPAHCQYCDKDYVNGDSITGIRFDFVEDPETLELTTPGVYYDGHYECVVEQLTKDGRLVEALQSGRLPTQAAVDASRVRAGS